VKNTSLVSTISQAVDPQGVIQRVSDRTLELIRVAQGVMVGLADADGIAYVCGAGSQMAFLGTRVDLAGSLSGLAVRSGEAQLSNNTRADSRAGGVARRRLSVASMVCVPLAREDETIGVLAINATRPNAFSDRDVEVLTRLGNFASVAVWSAFDLFEVCVDLLDFSQSLEPPERLPIAS
jgi:hypothetical protein